jgi:hypothetical protein
MMLAPASFFANGQSAAGAAATAQPQCKIQQLVREINRHNRVVPSLLFDNERKSKGLGMTTALKGRTTPEPRYQPITKDHTAEAISGALKSWGRDKSAPIARVQQIAAVDRKTAEAWWHGKNPPPFHQIVNLAKRIPELRSEVRRLLCLEQNGEEEFAREASELLRRFAR